LISVSHIMKKGTAKKREKKPKKEKNYEWREK
jgi:hypothetical protein